MHNFSTLFRKPVAFVSAPESVPVIKPPSPKPEQREEVPTPKVESFPVEWPATPTVDTESSAVPKSTEISEVASTLPEEDYNQRVGEVATPVIEQPPMLIPEQIRDEIREEPLPLDPASQYLLSIYNYWAVRQQELLTCQHDLKSRIRSQEAEIARIEVSHDVTL